MIEILIILEVLSIFILSILLLHEIVFFSYRVNSFVPILSTIIYMSILFNFVCIDMLGSLSIVG